MRRTSESGQEEVMSVSKLLLDADSRPGLNHQYCVLTLKIVSVSLTIFSVAYHNYFKILLTSVISFSMSVSDTSSA